MFICKIYIVNTSFLAGFSLSHHDQHQLYIKTFVHFLTSIQERVSVKAPLHANITICFHFRTEILFPTYC